MTRKQRAVSLCSYMLVKLLPPDLFLVWMWRFDDCFCLLRIGDFLNPPGVCVKQSLSVFLSEFEGLALLISDCHLLSVNVLTLRQVLGVSLLDIETHFTHGMLWGDPGRDAIFFHSVSWIPRMYQSAYNYTVGYTSKLFTWQRPLSALALSLCLLTLGMWPTLPFSSGKSGWDEVLWKNALIAQSLNKSEKVPSTWESIAQSVFWIKTWTEQVATSGFSSDLQDYGDENWKGGLVHTTPRQSHWLQDTVFCVLSKSRKPGTQC